MCEDVATDQSAGFFHHDIGNSLLLQVATVANLLLILLPVLDFFHFFCNLCDNCHLINFMKYSDRIQHVLACFCMMHIVTYRISVVPSKALAGSQNVSPFMAFEVWKADFARQDESTDKSFYSSPRICTHVDVSWPQPVAVEFRGCIFIPHPRTTLLPPWPSTMGRCSPHFQMPRGLQLTTSEKTPRLHSKAQKLLPIQAKYMVPCDVARCRLERKTSWNTCEGSRVQSGVRLERWTRGYRH